jgi:hypothetical protein
MQIFGCCTENPSNKNCPLVNCSLPGCGCGTHKVCPHSLTKFQKDIAKARRRILELNNDLIHLSWDFRQRKISEGRFVNEKEEIEDKIKMYGKKLLKLKHDRLTGFRVPREL